MIDGYFDFSLATKFTFLRGEQVSAGVLILFQEPTETIDAKKFCHPSEAKREGVCLKCFLPLFWN